MKIKYYEEKIFDLNDQIKNSKEEFDSLLLKYNDDLDI